MRTARKNDWIVDAQLAASDKNHDDEKKGFLHHVLVAIAAGDWYRQVYRVEMRSGASVTVRLRSRK